jgi:hypothetical protein
MEERDRDRLSDGSSLTLTAARPLPLPLAASGVGSAVALPLPLANAGVVGTDAATGVAKSSDRSCACRRVVRDGTVPRVRDGPATGPTCGIWSRRLWYWRLYYSSAHFTTQSGILRQGRPVIALV